MWKDPIVEETHRRREELAARFNYDIKAIGAELRRQQKAQGSKSVRRPPKARQTICGITNGWQSRR